MADNLTFELKIIEPDGIFYEGDSDFLEFVSTEGQRGIYKNHIPFAAILAEGMMRIHHGADVLEAEVSGGMIEVRKEKITVLAESIIWKK